MKIGPATPQDTPILSSLCGDVQRLHAQHQPGIFKMPEREDFAVSFFADMLADPNTHILIAEENGM